MPWRAVDAHNEGLDNQNGTLEVYRPVVADSHHFEEELDTDSHYSKKLDLGWSRKWIF